VKQTSILCLVALCLIAIPVFAGDAETDSTAVELVTLYQQMHGTLAADRTEGVVELASLIAQKAEPCECGAENTTEYAAVTAAALGMQGKDLAALREEFKPLSRAMASLVTATGAGSQIYYCPMVKGYWLQPSSAAEARNPYLGAGMPNCGSKVDKLDS
jgi:hypothetical protein